MSPGTVHALSPVCAIPAQVDRSCTSTPVPHVQAADVLMDEQTEAEALAELAPPLDAECDAVLADRLRKPLAAAKVCFSSPLAGHVAQHVNLCVWRIYSYCSASSQPHVVL